MRTATVLAALVMPAIMTATSAYGQNLLVNGDFEQGNTGFSTGYTFTGVGSTATTYDIVRDPRLVHGLATSYGDHPCGTGLMMVVNAATTANVDVWRQTVAVEANQQYRWSVWLSTWYAPSPARMSFRINGQQVATQNLTSTTGQWVLFQYFWNSVSNTSATLSIVDTNLDYGGNDFAIDDMFFGLSSASTTGLDLYLTRLEVNQSVQDTGMTLPLFAGKAALVRAFVDFDDTDNPARTQVTNVNGVLHVFRNNIEQLPPLNSQNGPITVKHAVTGARENDTLNFEMTQAQSDDVDLVLELNPTPHAVLERNYCNNTIRRDNLRFECRLKPKIRHVVIDYRPTAPTSGTNYPNSSWVATADRLVQTAYPTGADYQGIADAYWDTRLSTQVANAALFVALNDWRNMWLPSVGEPLYVFAWLPGNANVTIGNAGYGGYAIGSVGWGECDSESFARKVLAHEMGHMLGLCHVPNTGGADVCAPGLGIGTFPTGPLGGYGVDVARNYGRPRIKSPPGNCGGCLTSSPNASGSMCSFMLGGCHPDVNHGWIDTVTYRTIADSSRLQCAALAGAPEVQSLGIGGTFYPAADIGSIEGVMEIPGAEPTQHDPAGNIILIGRGGPSKEILYSVCTFASASSDDNSVAEPVYLYYVNIPARGDSPPYHSVDSIELLSADTGSVLATRERTAHSPAVAFKSPLSGEKLADGLTVSWSGADADGDALRYSLLYSADGGASFVPLMVRANQENFALAADRMAGSAPDAAILRLVASDGMNTTTIDLKSLTLDDPKPPTVTLLAPADATKLPLGASMTLSAVASDLEDGTLPDSSLVWTSSIDGLLGVGENLSIGNLSLGTHVLSVTAFDSSNLDNTQSVLLTIVPRSPALEGDLDSDGDVDADDAAAFVVAFGASATDPLGALADLDGSQVVDCADWTLLKSHWNGPPAGAPFLSLPAQGARDCESRR